MGMRLLHIERGSFVHGTWGSLMYEPSYGNSGADNLITKELTLKFATKITVGEQFAIYVVTPM